MVNVISQEGHEQKAFDGAGVMLEDVIGVPFVGQLVEGIIIDIPGQESKSGKSHQRHGRDR